MATTFSSSSSSAVVLDVDIGSCRNSGWTTLASVVLSAYCCQMDLEKVDSWNRWTACVAEEAFVPHATRLCPRVVCRGCVWHWSATLLPCVLIKCACWRKPQMQNMTPELHGSQYPLDHNVWMHSATCSSHLGRGSS